MTLNPLKSIQTTVLTTSRDVIEDKDMAWLYLIVSPRIYDNHEVFHEYLDKFDWHNEKERLVALNKNFQLLQNNQPHTLLRAVQALRDISDPIAKLKRTIKKGHVLNGLYAVKRSEDHNYLKSIADRALKDIGEQ